MNELRTFPEASSLVVAGNPAREAWRIMEGTAQTVQGSNALLHAGDFVALADVLACANYRNSIVALTQVAARGYDRAALSMAFLQEPSLARLALTRLTSELREVDMALSPHAGGADRDARRQVEGGALRRIAARLLAAPMLRRSRAARILRARVAGLASVHDRIHQEGLAARSDESGPDRFVPSETILERFGRCYRTGDVLFLEGEVGRECYLIHSGEVAIVTSAGGAEETLALLRPGDVCGEMSVLDRKLRSATAVARTDLRVLALDEPALNALVDSQPVFAFVLARMLASRIVETACALSSRAACEKIP